MTDYSQRLRKISFQLKSEPKTLIVIGLISFIVALFIIYSVTLFPYSLSVEMQMKQEGNVQIYYCSRAWFDESKSIKIPVDRDLEMQTFTVTLQKKNIKLLRIDPTGDFAIKSLTLHNRFNVYEYSADELYHMVKPLHHIKKVSKHNNQIAGITNGYDPYFQIIDLPVINKYSYFKYAISLIVVFSFLFVLFTIAWFRLIKPGILSGNLTRENVHIPDKIYFTMVTGIFIWFIFQGSYYALNIAEYIAPDENYHYKVSLFHSVSGNIFIQDTPDTYTYGALSVRPYLYHLIMGKLLLINIFNLPNVHFLRLISVILGLVLLYVTVLLAKELTKNRWIILTVLIVQTNILMFVFISSMISYDNLTNLLATTSFLLLIRFIKSFSRKYFLLLVISILAGSLTKVTYLPVVAIQFVILLSYIKSIYNNRQTIFIRRISPSDSIMLIFIIALFTLNLNLYGNNIITYGQLQPDTAKVIGDDLAYKNYSQTRRAVDLKASINERDRMPFYEYLLKYLERTEGSIAGIVGHKQLLKTNPELLFYRLLLLSGAFIFIFNVREKRIGDSHKIILFSVICYALIVLLTNYKSYLAFNAFGIALQGRYNFPVLVLANIFVVYNLMIRFQDRIKIGLMLTIAVFFIYNNFFWFLANATPDWYAN